MKETASTLPSEFGDNLRRSKVLWSAYQAIRGGPRSVLGFIAPGRYVRGVVQRFQRFKQTFPDRDTNAWLAATYKCYRPLLYRPEESFWYVETAAYSVLNGTNPALTLGCYLVVANAGLGGRLNDSVSKASENLEDVMAPVSKLVRDGDFVDVWKRKNYWSACNLPAVVEAIAEPEFWNSIDLAAQLVN